MHQYFAPIFCCIRPWPLGSANLLHMACFHWLSDKLLNTTVINHLMDFNINSDNPLGISSGLTSKDDTQNLLQNNFRLAFIGGMVLNHGCHIFDLPAVYFKIYQQHMLQTYVNDLHQYTDQFNDPLIVLWSFLHKQVSYFCMVVINFCIKNQFMVHGCHCLKREKIGLQVLLCCCWSRKGRVWILLLNSSQNISLVTKAAN